MRLTGVWIGSTEGGTFGRPHRLFSRRNCCLFVRSNHVCEVEMQQLTIRAQVDLRSGRDGRFQPYIRNLPSLRYGRVDLETPVFLTSKHSRPMGRQSSWFCCEFLVISLVEYIFC